MAGWILWRRNFFAEQRTTNYQYSFIPGNNNVGRGDFNSQEYIEFQLRAGGDILKIWVSRTDRRAADGGLTAQIANIGNSRGNFLTTAPGDLGQQGFDGRAFASPTAEGRIQEFLANVVHSSAANGCQ
jgi:hypothetical protein